MSPIDSTSTIQNPPGEARFSLEQALRGREAQAREADVVLLDVPYFGLDDAMHLGQIVIARALRDEVRAIFEEILQARFPLASVIPVAAFNWSDDESMKANNSSGFNPRAIVGSTRLSHHSTGRAIDLNPALNPFIKGEMVLPPAATYDPRRAGTLTPDSVPVRAFESRGWVWGGRWMDRLDYHHFEKPLAAPLAAPGVPYRP